MTGLLSLGGNIAPVESRIVQEIRAGASFWARAWSAVEVHGAIPSIEVFDRGRCFAGRQALAH